MTFSFKRCVTRWKSSETQGIGGCTSLAKIPMNTTVDFDRVQQIVFWLRPPPLYNHKHTPVCPSERTLSVGPSCVCGVCVCVGGWGCISWSIHLQFIEFTGNLHRVQRNILVSFWLFWQKKYLVGKWSTAGLLRLAGGAAIRHQETQILWQSMTKCQPVPWSSVACLQMYDSHTTY